MENKDKMKDKEEPLNEKANKCQYSDKCEAEVEVVYYGLGLCDKHWIKITEMPLKDAHKKLGIKETHCEHCKEIK